MDIRPARRDTEVADAATLILELIETNKTLYSDDLDLIDSLYQNSWVYAEPLLIPDRYRPPRGDILLAYAQGTAVGTVAFCPMGSVYCELKWMYVAANWRGTGVASALCTALITRAAQCEYGAIRLHTGPRQPEAHRLYDKLGFGEVRAWEDAPLDGVKYFELPLDN